MSDDPRCCGSGHCIIDTEGRCWCGQVWNGEAMCAPGTSPPETEAHAHAPGPEAMDS